MFEVGKLYKGKDNFYAKCIAELPSGNFVFDKDNYGTKWIDPNYANEFVVNKNNQHWKEVETPRTVKIAIAEILKGGGKGQLTHLIPYPRFKVGDLVYSETYKIIDILEYTEKV